MCITFPYKNLICEAVLALDINEREAERRDTVRYT